jgi:chemotaxis protein methyltransferase CheR
LIYFDQRTRDRVLFNLHRNLKPGGYLITGYADNLMNTGHPFRYLKPTLYQKPERIEAGTSLLRLPQLTAQPA